MRMYDVIAKKRNGGTLNDEEIKFFLDGYVAGEIPDYQVSALMMAIYFQGMTDEELGIMTMLMAKSGDMVDLSAIEGMKVDKHSTGGVGDKTTLVIGPIVAACGGKVAKMSGRGLGHTGGTVDKLESIPNYRTDLNQEEFFSIVNKIGISLIGQSGNLAPADKKLYALRDVTATVESIPLIAASIMSKKLAAGSDAIVLDVKTGSGAFMKTLDDSITLAQKMVAIGEHNGRKTVALITDMDTPLGHGIGNILEVKEVVDTLKGNGPADLTHECIELAGNMLYVIGKGTLDECKEMASKSLQDGSAFNKFVEVVEAQGGDTSVLHDTEKFAKATHVKEIIAGENDCGYVYHMNSEKIGISSVILGAGRMVKEAPIDFTAGIVINKKTGDKVEKGDVLATLYTSRDEKLLTEAEIKYREALEIKTEQPKPVKSIYARVMADSVTMM